MRCIRELVSGMRLLAVSCVVMTCLFSSPTVFGLQAEQQSSPTPRDTGGIGKSKLSEKPVEVLGGRLTIRMPGGSKKEGRPSLIMAAQQPEEHETRVIFDAGHERLVLMAHESFALAGDDFEKDVKEWVAKWTGKYSLSGEAAQVRLRVLMHAAPETREIARTRISSIPSSADQPQPGRDRAEDSVAQHKTTQTTYYTATNQNVPFDPLDCLMARGLPVEVKSN